MPNLIFIAVFCCGLFLIMILALYLIVKYVKLTLKYNRLTKYLYKYLNIITSARYGNLNLRCEDGIDALTIQLSRNTNGLIESIYDRDIMINEYIEKEKQTVNLKQDFISSLAHDLKVPIIAQDNTYDLFLNNRFGDINSEQKAALKNLKISNNDLKNLILNLLDAQKMDRNEPQITKENTDIISLINELLEQNKSIILFQDKTVAFNHSDNELYLEIDPFLIKRVLNNLISNAIFYSKNSKNITITVEKSNDNVKISLKDEGLGINEEDINNIFKKYYTCAKKYSNVGSGLGLYIASKIIRAHNGSISAKNNPDKGACFTISLPCHQINRNNT